MSEAKRIVVEQYPAEKLPEDLRQGIDPSHKVLVMVLDRPEPAVGGFEEKLLKYWGAAGDRGITPEEAVARVRALRDEWN